MNILYIDTHSTKIFSIGYFNGEILTKKTGNDASIELIEKIEELSKNKIDQIIINTGPGSLTGLRIGSSLAQGISLGKNIKILGISLWNLLLKEYPDIEIYFNTGTKKWIYKTSKVEIITEKIPNYSKKWISNKPDLLNFSIENNVSFPNLIGLMHKFRDLACEDINLLYPINLFKI